MQAADKARFANLLTGIADYYGRELSNAAIGLYWRGWEQYDLADVERALWQHTQNPDTGQFMPKIADVTRALQGRTQDQAAIAWSKVDAAVRSVGCYADVIFDDPLIHRVIAEMGGWIWFGKQSEEEWPFVARRFETAYRGYRLRHELPPHQPRLTGLANASNALESRAGQAPVLIGDLARAQSVQTSGSNAPLLALHRAAAQVPAALEQIMTPIQNDENLKPTTLEAA